MYFRTNHTYHAKIKIVIDKQLVLRCSVFATQMMKQFQNQQQTIILHYKTICSSSLLFIYATPGHCPVLGNCLAISYILALLFIYVAILIILLRTCGNLAAIFFAPHKNVGLTMKTLSNITNNEPMLVNVFNAFLQITLGIMIQFSFNSFLKKFIDFADTSFGSASVELFYLFVLFIVFLTATQ